MNGAELILSERRRQMEREGWTPEHDAQHSHGELIFAAICYAVNKQDYHPAVDIGGDSDAPGVVPVRPRTVHGFFGPYQDVDWEEPAWPWSDEWDKREKHDRIKSLMIAGALIAAEIDRLQRATAEESSEHRGG